MLKHLTSQFVTKKSVNFCTAVISQNAAFNQYGVNFRPKVNIFLLVEYCY